jgi:RHH-type proline utilization regulon transcriptional repressor/proline dehydrogenase/delta 1-pyrroline-5-carboxylate dehydrogenase
VSEAVDFAHYYAERALELDEVDGAAFVPARLTVVTPPWNFPVSIPAGSALAALATGSAVVLKPAGPAGRCGAVLAEAMWAAGVPEDVLTLVQVDEAALGSRLIGAPEADQVVLTGAFETAELFRTIRPDLRLLAETSGKNAMVITPSADLDLAVKDLVASAFGHAGQKCSAASLAILVGSVGRSKRFLDQLADAVRSLPVGEAWDATTRMGPLIEPASGKLLEGLTRLGPGEHWLVQPRRLDGEGRIWTPGVRTGVRPGSDFHRIEYFGPVLGILTADTLDEAIALQNDVAFGLTAGLHALDPEEIGRWLGRVQAGNLYVNRGTTGAIVGRQPFGGWKRSAVGPGAKAGGPNHLATLGSWRPDGLAGAPAPDHLPATLERIVRAADRIGADAGAWVRAGVASDAAAWATEFGATRELAGLAAERNLFRYRAVPVRVHVEDDARPEDVLRVLAAGTRAGSPMRLSSNAPLPDVLRAVADGLGVECSIEDAPRSGRVRLVGGSAPSILARAKGVADLALYGDRVTTAGRVELLPFLREQSVSITAHRFGTPDHLTDALL